MQTVELKAEIRTSFGKGPNRQLKKQGLIPGVYYHHGDENIHFFVKENDLRPLVYTSETHVVDLILSNGVKKQAVAKSFQFDPVTDRPIHVDLQGVVKGEKITVDVPVSTTGTAPGVVAGGVLQLNYHVLHVRTEPSNIPEHIMLDVSNLQLGGIIHAGDIKLPGIEIMNDPKISVVTVAHRRTESAAPATPTTETKAE